jgi:8-oxo-dGTP pyrophosphatase MutT (NUDIX family)
VQTDKKTKTPAAGIVVVKNFTDGWRVLGLKLGGEYDLPKGKIDPGESDFDCAVRETYEESGIGPDELYFTWGDIHKKIKHIIFFIAETNAEPNILRNPKTGMYEHDSAEWLNWEDMRCKCYPYLSEIVDWAKQTIEEGRYENSNTSKK